MSEHSDPTFLLLGLSGTGKTNFLVATDVVLDYQTEPDGLVHAGPAADRAYLQPLREKWLRGEVLEHTSRLQPPTPHHLLTKHPRSGRAASFYVPDLAGESFESYFELRGFPAEVSARIREAAGLCLFIHSDGSASHEVLAHPQLRELMESEDGGSDGVAGEQPKEWQIGDACDQVKLVDLLQFVFESRKAGQPFDIAVVVSAWDLVEKMPGAAGRLTPDEYFSKHWPLLYQYLKSLPKSVRHRIFGVSARGGGNSKEEVHRLTVEIQKPRDRIIVVDGSHRSGDISRPIRWMLGLLNENNG